MGPVDHGQDFKEMRAPELRPHQYSKITNSVGQV